jgi:hypothetical protein
VFKIVTAQSDSETEVTDASPIHSKYIHSVLSLKVSQDHTFGEYQDDTYGSFKIGNSNFKYNDKYVFVDSKNSKTTQGLWELLTKTRSDKNMVTPHDKQNNKHMHIEVITGPPEGSERTKALSIHSLFYDSLRIHQNVRYLGNL